MKRVYLRLAAALIAASVLVGCEHYGHYYRHDEGPEFHEGHDESHEGYREGHDREGYEGHEEEHRGY